MITFTFASQMLTKRPRKLSSLPNIRRGPARRFPLGKTSIVRAAEDFAQPSIPIGLDLEIVRLAAGTTRMETSPLETAWVLLGGSATIECRGRTHAVERGSLFDIPPTTLHVGPDEPVHVRAQTREVEFAVIRVANGREFEPRLFQGGDMVPEYRGAGLVQGACLREVRLIFDRKERPEANLVLGEVVNYPGRWSSYPPHHHAQPEVYHYRFSEASGYGHAELGDEVFKVRSNDTVCIPPGLDHGQVSAPGYAMYYLWAIRHLPRRPYSGFTFAKDHVWTLDQRNQGWHPSPRRGAKQ